MTARYAPHHALPTARFVPGDGAPHPRKTGDLVTVPEEDALAMGADLFHAGCYWEAHEVWEGLWLALGRSGDAARAVQALIKLAAAGVKVLQDQPEGVRRHASGALALLDGLPDWPAELACAADVEALRRFARATRDHPPRARAGAVFDDALPFATSASSSA